MILFVFTASLSFAGGWDKSKGMDKVSLKGEIVCLGCTLKKMNGANAQCSLYSQHEMGFKSADGTLWSIVDNAKGHDITRAHQLLGHKQATITGWLYPLAHFIEIDNIDVEGVSKAKIEKAGWDEDQLISKRLSSRKVGEAPILAHEHK
jgi:hypothetical protein